MNGMSVPRNALVCAALLFATGCPSGFAAKAARGENPGATSAFGTRTCTGPGNDVEPWVVDMPADRRVEIEAEMQKGVVLVAYDCKTVDLVRGCKTSGDYGYTGTTLVEDEVVLDDADSVAANLSGGAILAAKLQAEMNRGMKVHIGYVLVGQRSTTIRRVSRADLIGDCDRVTHFIARSSLGAYAMIANSSAKMGAVAEVFSRGASASSSSSSFKSTTAGDKPACQSASPDDGAPPIKCRAPVKLLLSAISTTNIAASEEPPFEENRPVACPENMVRKNGACVHNAPSLPRMCVMANQIDCDKQCSAGDAPSCARLGFMYESGKGIGVDDARAYQFYQRACDAGSIDGCVGLGFLFSKGRFVNRDLVRAAKMFRDACERGHARACNGIGQQARIEGNAVEAIRWFERSCNLGYARACFYAGNLLATEGKEPERALRNHQDACVGRDDRGCLAMAGMIFSGLGTAPDPIRAKELQTKALESLTKDCTAGDIEACGVIGDFYNGRYGKEVRKPEKALEFYDKACQGGRGDACRSAGALLELGDGNVVSDPAKSQKYFEQACGRGVKEACR
jgi:TPR repeat protein